MNCMWLTIVFSLFLVLLIACRKVVVFAQWCSLPLERGCSTLTKWFVILIPLAVCAIFASCSLSRAL